MIEIPDNFTLFDIIAHCDEIYHSKIRQKLTMKEKEKILYFENTEFLLQAIWSPKTNLFHEDVQVEVLIIENGPKVFPLRDNLLREIPDNSTLTVTPDAGC